MSKVTLMLGSNIDDRFSFLTMAYHEIINKIGQIINYSSIYETEPWGFAHESNFLNQIVISESILSPQILLSEINMIENKMGRTRSNEQYQARTIDIDILFYDNLIFNEKDLIIPHQHISLRRFVLIPLYEIQPEYVHPVLKKTIKQLLEECTDQSDVKLIQSIKRNS
jgi:2-amino-4-hydroxy-6-hydroxymethyldihydropteridine diphosphokinase